MIVVAKIGIAHALEEDIIVERMPKPTFSGYLWNFHVVVVEPIICMLCSFHGCSTHLCLSHTFNIPVFDEHYVMLCDSGRRINNNYHAELYIYFIVPFALFPSFDF